MAPVELSGRNVKAKQKFGERVACYAQRNLALPIRSARYVASHDPSELSGMRVAKDAKELLYPYLK